MDTKKYLHLTMAFLALFLLVSCTQKTNIQDLNVSVTLGQNISQIPKLEVTTPDFKNFSVIGPQIKEGDEPIVKEENYDISNEASFNTGCYESDGQENTDVKGYVKDNTGKVFKDYCSGAKLIENKCGVTGANVELVFNCKYGCSDGACSKPDPSQICKDSDNGEDYYEKGTLSYKNINFTDNCRDSDYLNEYYCANNGVNSKKEILCSAGCQDGVCLPKVLNSPEECIDSDPGLEERTTKGYVKDVNGIVYDECFNSITVVEYKCNVLGYRMKKNMVCNAGYKCEDGACVTK